MGSDLGDQLAQAFKAGYTLGQGGMSITDNPSAGDTHTKAEVNYRQCDNGEECCANCVHYSQHKCEIVSGRVDPQMTCDEFNAKDNPSYPQQDQAPTNDSQGYVPPTPGVKNEN